MQPETKFKTKVLNKLKSLDKTFVIKVQQKTICGTPDIIICCNGLFVAWELKVKDNKASPLQQYNLNCITNAGGMARVVTPETLEENYKELLYVISNKK